MKICRTAFGFTLIELMISMAIFAILSALAYGGLSSVIKNKERTEQSMLRLNQLQLTMTKLHRDFEQLSIRTATDGLGTRLLPISAGQGSDDVLVQFTRNGWRNPAKNTRSHLQRVAYKLDEDSLIRMSWIHIDRAQDDQLIETVLMDNLADVQLRFLDENNNWQDRWPQINADSSATSTPQLRAVEVKLSMNDWGDISRTFRTTSGAGTKAANNNEEE